MNRCKYWRRFETRKKRMDVKTSRKKWFLGCAIKSGRFLWKGQSVRPRNYG